MTTYEQNVFEGSKVRLDGSDWRGNLFRGCAILVDSPPKSFPGNRLIDCSLTFSGEAGAMISFLREMCAANPDLRPVVAEAIGLTNAPEDPQLKH